MEKTLTKINKEEMLLGVTREQASETAIEAIKWVRKIINNRPDKLVVHGKQYIELQDWEFIGLYFKVYARTDSARRLYQEVPAGNGDYTKQVPWGVEAVCSTFDLNGNKLSTAIMECTKDEPQFKDKPMNQISAMAQTRGCRRAYIQTLRWVFEFGDNSDLVIDEEAEEIATPTKQESIEKQLWEQEEIPPHIPQTEADLLAWVCHKKGFLATQTARTWLIKDLRYAPERIAKDPGGIYEEIKERV